MGDGQGSAKRKKRRELQVGDIITISAETREGFIQWLVNGKIKASYVMERLKERPKEWVPFIVMCDPGDKVLWMD